MSDILDLGELSNAALQKLEDALRQGIVNRVVLTYAERGPVDCRIYDIKMSELSPYKTGDIALSAIMDVINATITDICGGKLDEFYPNWRKRPKVDGKFLFVCEGDRLRASWQHTEQDIGMRQSFFHVLR